MKARWIRATLVAFGAMCSLLAIAFGDEPGPNPYEAISQRNPFGLKLSSEVARADSAAPAISPASSLRLTGISVILERKWAFLAREERGRVTEYLSLREGETHGSIEVREVRAEHQEVHLLVDGRDLTLSFTDQNAREQAAQRAEKKFVEEHTRAHEALQRRERERLAREQAGL